METKKIVIGEKEFIIKELLACDVDTIDFDDKKEALKKQVMLSTGMSEEEYTKLTLKERLGILKIVSEINGLNDFMNPPKQGG